MSFSSKDGKKFGSAYAAKRYDAEHSAPQTKNDVGVDGTKLSGFVTDKAKRECGNCAWYKDEHCTHPVVTVDPDVPGETGEPKPVKEKWCCNFFRPKAKR